MASGNGGRFGDENRKRREAYEQHHGKLRGRLKDVLERLRGGS